MSSLTKIQGEMKSMLNLSMIKRQKKYIIMKD